MAQVSRMVGAKLPFGTSDGENLSQSSFKAGPEEAIATPFA